MPKIQFPNHYTVRLNIHPQSFGVDERMRASALATESDVGVRMEVHSSHTEFWLDPDVPVGQVSVWMSRTYKGWLEYAETLETPDAPFDAWHYKWKDAEDAS